MKKILVLCLTFLFAKFAFGSVILTNYVNRNDWPVKITVPYYAPKTSNPIPLEITLQPGDYYHPIRKKNGILFPKYTEAKKIIEKTIKDKEHKQQLPEILMSYENYLSVETMPQSWIEQSSNTFLYAKEWIEELLAKPEMREKYKRQFEEEVCVTNIPESAFALLSDPKADPDGDGLTNAEEAYCNCNPLIKNRLIIKPAYFRVQPKGETIVTSYFEVVNLSTNTFHVYLGFQHIKYTVPWQPRLLDPETKNIISNNYRPSYHLFADQINFLYFDLAPTTSKKVALLVDEAGLPFEIWGSIYCQAYSSGPYTPEEVLYALSRKYEDKKNSTVKNPVKYEKITGDNPLLWKYGEAQPVLFDYVCPSTAKPILTSPPNGSCYTNISKVAFTWDDDTKNKQIRDGDYLSYSLESYSLQDRGNGFEISGINRLEILEDREYDIFGLESVTQKRIAKFDSDIENTFYDYEVPCILAWRVSKVTSSSAYSHSDWGWVCVGTPIAPPDNTKLRLKKREVKHEMRAGKDYIYDFFDDYVFVYLYKNAYWNAKTEADFIKPLPEWIKKVPSNSSKFPFSLEASPPLDYRGVFTNYLVVTYLEQTVTNRHIFIVKRNRMRK